MDLRALYFQTRSATQRFFYGIIRVFYTVTHDQSIWKQPLDHFIYKHISTVEYVWVINDGSITIPILNQYFICYGPSYVPTNTL